MDNDEDTDKILEKLPKLNCGLCGFRSCAEFATDLKGKPSQVEKCVNLSQKDKLLLIGLEKAGQLTSTTASASEEIKWVDTLSRSFDFVLETFPNEPGPRETILPHNPALTKELEIKKGDILIGRPLGMSCGCPITHCGVVMDVDYRTGVIVWCVTGPLQPRIKGYKDLGYYVAEAYEGIIRHSKSELRIGMRYWFLPRRCMLQWRHSGLINFMNKIKDGYQVRIEGLMIG